MLEGCGVHGPMFYLYFRELMKVSMLSFVKSVETSYKDCSVGK